MSTPALQPAWRTSPGARVRIHESIHDVDAEEWDSILSPDDQQVAHRFVRTCEDAHIEDARYRHVLVEERGRLAAVATLSAMTLSLDLLVERRAVRGAVARARRVHPGLLRMPVVLCGLPVSFGRSCIRFADGASAGVALDAVARAAEDFADEVGAGLLCFKEHTQAETRTLDRLLGSGYVRVPSLPACSLPCRWASFEEYTASLRAGYRRQLRADLCAGKAAGLRARVLADFRAECDVVYGMYAEVMQRARHRLEHLTPAFLANLNRNLPGEARLILVERGAQPLGAAVVLERPGTLTFLLVGLDYDANRPAHVYFNLMIEIIREAVRRGVQTLELGQTSYLTKTRWGGELSPLWVYVRHRNRVADRLLRSTAGLLFPVVRAPVRRVWRAAGGEAIP